MGNLLWTVLRKMIMIYQTFTVMFDLDRMTLTSVNNSAEQVATHMTRPHECSHAYIHPYTSTRTWSDQLHFNRFMWKRRNASAYALAFRLLCMNLLIWSVHTILTTYDTNLTKELFLRHLPLFWLASVIFERWLPAATYAKDFRACFSNELCCFANCSTISSSRSRCSCSYASIFCHRFPCVCAKSR